jgi:ABC-type transporter Mla MlaB component
MPEFSMVWSDGALAGERILKLSGPFTLSAVFEFQSSVRENGPPITVIDLTDVPYMDSAAMGSLLGVAGVDSILAIYGSLAEAEAALGGPAASA